jgi:hypothetical protein
LRQSIQTSQEIKGAVDIGALPDRGLKAALRRISLLLLINTQDSELSTRTDSFQFGRPFRRDAAEVGATGVPCQAEYAG